MIRYRPNRRRYFITTGATYELLRQAAAGASGLVPSLQLTASSDGKLLVSMVDDVANQPAVVAALSPLLAEGAVQEVTEPEWNTAVANAAVAAASPEEVVEFLTAAQFPATGNSSLLYIATDAGRAYRWVGTAYAEIGPTSFATVTPPTASASTLGGVRIGSGVSIDNSGVISVSTAYAAATHSHAIADVTGLQSALDGKAAVSHTHVAAGITDFGAAADARIAASDKVSSNATGIAGADQITNIVSLTQAEYDAIGTKNAATLYVIAGG